MKLKKLLLIAILSMFAFVTLVACNGNGDDESDDNGTDPVVDEIEDEDDE